MCQGYVLGTLEGDGMSFDTLGECITYHAKYVHAVSYTPTCSLADFHRNKGVLPRALQLDAVNRLFKDQDSSCLSDDGYLHLTTWQRAETRSRSWIQTTSRCTICARP